MTTFGRFVAPEFFEVDKNGCWNWKKGKNKKGYGRLKHNGRVHFAHRYFYEKANGPIPEGLSLDHLCRNRGCINPSHLESVTTRENILRGEGLAANQARQTKCKRGHEFNKSNTIRSGTARICRTCYNFRKRKHKVNPKG